MALLYERAGRLTAKNGGCWPGQWEAGWEKPRVTVCRNASSVAAAAGGNCTYPCNENICEHCPADICIEASGGKCGLDTRPGKEACFKIRAPSDPLFHVMESCASYPISPGLTTVRALPGRSHALSVFHRKYNSLWQFVWTRRLLKGQKWRFPARAVGDLPHPAQGLRDKEGLLSGPARGV